MFLKLQGSGCLEKNVMTDGSAVALTRAEAGRSQIFDATNRCTLALSWPMSISRAFVSFFSENELEELCLLN